MASKSQLLRQAKSFELPEHENLGLSTYVLGRRQHQQFTERVQKEKEELEEERWEEKKMLDKKIKRLEGQVERYKQDLNEVQSKNDDLISENRKLDRELRYANDRVSELQMEMDKMKAHVTSLETSNRTLKTLAKKAGTMPWSVM
ncbi:PREDICTED: leucine-rich repeat flightless-interacting protein 2-like isoform X1 [Branchiostoma belcheri]|uniref:Leucine-rich repeat flightless-interacting protein 2-like isoform X1 n=2 Tax=Branchiostoma belcheri TaxID=7741 RepID=A0A6P4YEI5_BRABE|nr:PREDICTED: leucine-rich repeat flightless-interacting protein 2-like isoform X1 [Branchiostoma belcheri]